MSPQYLAIISLMLAILVAILVIKYDKLIAQNRGKQKQKRTRSIRVGGNS